MRASVSPPRKGMKGKHFEDEDGPNAIKNRTNALDVSTRDDYLFREVLRLQ
jgi:hypothetical protein